MLSFFKLLSPANRFKFFVLIAMLTIVTAVATYLVVHFSNLFSLGMAWGWFLTFVIWSWFTTWTNAISKPLIRPMLARWVEEAMKDAL